MKHDRIWIVVADGSRAQIFLNSGPGTGLLPAMQHALVADNRPSGSISSDRPGRTFDSAGSGRHAMEPSTDPHRHAQMSFAHDLAELLDEKRKKKVFEQILIIAAPRMLGDLRLALKEETKKLVIGEIDKDLTKLSVKDLTSHLENTIKL